MGGVLPEAKSVACGVKVPPLALPIPPLLGDALPVASEEGMGVRVVPPELDTLPDTLGVPPPPPPPNNGDREGRGEKEEEGDTLEVPVGGLKLGDTCGEREEEREPPPPEGVPLHKEFVASPLAVAPIESVVSGDEGWVTVGVTVPGELVGRNGVEVGEANTVGVVPPFRLEDGTLETLPAMPAEDVGEAEDSGVAVGTLGVRLPPLILGVEGPEGETLPVPLRAKESVGKSKDWVGFNKGVREAERDWAGLLLPFPPPPLLPLPVAVEKG